MDSEKLAETILDQIKVIRDTGLTNMFMDYTVKRIEENMGFNELVNYMDENPNGYFGTLLRGKVEF